MSGVRHLEQRSRGHLGMARRAAGRCRPPERATRPSGIAANGAPGAYNRVSSDGQFTYAYDAEGNRTLRYVDENDNGVADAGDTDLTS